MAGGAERTRLAYAWRNSCRKKLVEHYTIELKDNTRVYQKHHHTGTARPLRAVQWVTPTGTYAPLPLVRGFEPPALVLPFDQDGPCELPEWL